MIICRAMFADMEEEKRKLYSNMRFTMEYTKTGSDWSYTVYMPNGINKTFNFALGEEFDSTTLDGRPIIVSQHHKNPNSQLFPLLVIH